MNIKSCLEIGVNCGLETIEEAIFNIKLHRANLFVTEEIESELEELEESLKNLCLHTDFNLQSDCKRVLKYL